MCERERVSVRACVCRIDCVNVGVWVCVFYKNSCSKNNSSCSCSINIMVRHRKLFLIVFACSFSLARAVSLHLSRWSPCSLAVVQCIAVHYSVLQYAAMCCSVFKCAAVHCNISLARISTLACSIHSSIHSTRSPTCAAYNYTQLHTSAYKSPTTTYTHCNIQVHTKMQARTDDLFIIILHQRHQPFTNSCFSRHPFPLPLNSPPPLLFTPSTGGVQQRIQIETRQRFKILRTRHPPLHSPQPPLPPCVTFFVGRFASRKGRGHSEEGGCKGIDCLFLQLIVRAF